MKSVFVTLLVLLFISCHKDSGVIKELDRIKTIGDTNSVEALSLLDSIRPYAANSSQYAQMKYDLLTVRVSDKAMIVPESDSLIKRVLPYFLKNGNTKEKQETYYYAGSVYRDLEDYPRALSYYLKAKELCVKDYDSLILRNTYSNLVFVYYGTQDFLKAFIMAKRSCLLSNELGILDPTDLNQLGISLLGATKDKEKAGKVFEESYRLLKSQWNTIPYSERLYHTSMLLHFFCLTDRLNLAEECYNLINSEFPGTQVTNTQKFNLAIYYIRKNRLSDAAAMLEDIMSGNTDVSMRYDCTKYLSEIYSVISDTKKAIYYSSLFRNLTDTVDFGGRQTMAATVNNQYKYYKEKNSEVRLIRKSEKWEKRVSIVTYVSIFVIALIIVLYFRNKSILLKKLFETETTLTRVKEKVREGKTQLAAQENHIASLHSELEKSQKTKNELDEKMNSQTIEIATLKETLENMAVEKTSLEKEAQKVKAQLDGQFEETRRKKELFSGFMQAYFLSESKLKNEEFAGIMQKVADYSTPMTEAYWKKLYAVVDEQNPDFSQKVREHIQPFNEEKVKYCYLMRYGMKSTQIMHVMNTKSSTHYRRMEDLSWVWTS